MRKIIGWAAFAALIVIVFSCASDIVLEEPPSLKGVYEGWYIITKLGEERENKQTIRWVFDDINFHLDIDTTKPGWNRDFCVCNYGGPYVVEEKVKLTVTNAIGPGYPGCQACNPEREPTGAFAPETKGDTLILTFQDTVNDLLKEIKIVPISQ